MKKFAVLIVAALALAACGEPSPDKSDTKKVKEQQKQYAKGQPLPVFDWSLERDLVIQLYRARNSEVATHTVWRSNYGMVEGDCPSIGFGIPYDTSLTNPLKIENSYSQGGFAITEQAEPNGLYASKNSAATWVMCVVKDGERVTTVPVYIESKVTVYPMPVSVDYASNRVTFGAGKSSVVIKRRQ